MQELDTTPKDFFTLHRAPWTQAWKGLLPTAFFVGILQRETFYDLCDLCYDLGK